MANSENSYYLKDWGRVPKEGTNLEKCTPSILPTWPQVESELTGESEQATCGWWRNLLVVGTQAGVLEQPTVGLRNLLADEGRQELV